MRQVRNTTCVGCANDFCLYIDYKAWFLFSLQIYIQENQRSAFGSIDFTERAHPIQQTVVCAVFSD